MSIDEIVNFWLNYFNKIWNINFIIPYFIIKDINLYKENCKEILLQQNSKEKKIMKNL